MALGLLSGLIVGWLVWRSYGPKGLTMFPFDDVVQLLSAFVSGAFVALVVTGLSVGLLEAFLDG